MIKFALNALIHVYGGEHPGHEIMDLTHIHDRSIECDVSEDIDIILDDVEYPKEEGIHRLWIVGSIRYHQDYWGEWDMDFDIDVEQFSPASKADIAHINSEYPSSDEVFKFEI